MNEKNFVVCVGTENGKNLFFRDGYNTEYGYSTTQDIKSAYWFTIKELEKLDVVLDKFKGTQRINGSFKKNIKIMSINVTMSEDISDCEKLVEFLEKKAMRKLEYYELDILGIKDKAAEIKLKY